MIDNKTMEDILSNLKTHIDNKLLPSNEYTKANAGVIEAHNTFQDYVDCGFNPRHLELFESVSGTFYIYSDGKELLKKEWRGTVIIDAENYENGFYLMWGDVGAPVNIYWKAYA